MKRFMSAMITPKLFDEEHDEHAVVPDALEQEIDVLEQTDDAAAVTEDTAIDADVIEAEQVGDSVEQVDAIKETIATEGYTKSIAMLCERFGIVEYANTKFSKAIVGHESLTSGRNEEMAKLMSQVCDELIIQGNESLSSIMNKIKTKIGQLATNVKQKFQDFDKYFKSDIEAKLKGVTNFDDEKLGKKVRIYSKKEAEATLAIVEKYTKILSETISNMAAKANKDVWVSSKTDRSAATEILDKYNVTIAEMVRVFKRQPKPSKQTVKDANWKASDAVAFGNRLIKISDKLIDLSHSTEELCNKFVLIFPLVGPAIFNLINQAVIHVHQGVYAMYQLAQTLVDSIRRTGMVYVYAIEK